MRDLIKHCKWLNQTKKINTKMLTTIFNVGEYAYICKYLCASSQWAELHMSFGELIATLKLVEFSVKHHVV